MDWVPILDILSLQDRFSNYDFLVFHFIDDFGHWILPNFLKMVFPLFLDWISNVHVDLRSNDNLLWCFSANGEVTAKII